MLGWVLCVLLLLYRLGSISKYVSRLIGSILSRQIVYQFYEVFCLDMIDSLSISLVTPIIMLENTKNPQQIDSTTAVTRTHYRSHLEQFFIHCKAGAWCGIDPSKHLELVLVVGQGWTELIQKMHG